MAVFDVAVFHIASHALGIIVAIRTARGIIQ